MTYSKYTQNCPICGRQLRVKTCYVGMTLTCQHCHGNFIARDTSSLLTPSSSIWDVEITPSVETVLSRLQDNLEKSGIMDESRKMIHGVNAR